MSLVTLSTDYILHSEDIYTLTGYSVPSSDEGVSYSKTLTTRNFSFQ